MLIFSESGGIILIFEYGHTDINKEDLINNIIIYDPAIFIMHVHPNYINYLTHLRTLCIRKNTTTPAAVTTARRITQSIPRIIVAAAEEKTTTQHYYQDTTQLFIHCVLFYVQYLVSISHHKIEELKG